MNPSLAAAQPAATGLSRALVALLAFCCGAIVANIYSVSYTHLTLPTKA